MAARDEVDYWEVFLRTSIFLLAAAVACGIGFLFYVAWLGITSGNTEYTVTITGVDGLDAAALRQRGDLAALSPVLDIAVRIDNTLNKAGNQCFGKHASAVVSYRDAVLGKGTVPEFCAQTLGVGETTATAWAMDAQMPRFLRDRLAGEMERGEAVLDVAVRAPGSGSCDLQDCVDGIVVRPRGAGSCYVYRCMDLLLDCKAKIGGGPSPPCLVTDVEPSPPCLVTDVEPLSTGRESF
ncbi:hypothetical protein QYE76_044979 [Lolium multiflorum]|uniref:Uncharacterized protein n=1 Tax=Lolium multiflorum TaxID=4521 RepID=A0AAD8TM41_LOLMU|nr:hypothetical protein QYE76_044979 [Lolium multiflorum]